ncbi:serine/arginine repetitive matrix protein 1 [Scaptodrosophila lebanonensis]|uniref:Serine/arginine repetitive matrix protein 1 n=1 Tax=Drosophila lebanonensis TaxID=7225 RepID=A0A6J2TPF3_DROLE|nr:serine/arginine repetitive matrix protein 1 [Scaptodrosophila lebanonensis]
MKIAIAILLAGCACLVAALKPVPGKTPEGNFSAEEISTDAAPAEETEAEIGTRGPARGGPPRGGPPRGGPPRGGPPRGGPPRGGPPRGGPGFDDRRLRELLRDNAKSLDKTNLSLRSIDSVNNQIKANLAQQKDAIRTINKIEEELANQRALVKEQSEGVITSLSNITHKVGHVIITRKIQIENLARLQSETKDLISSLEKKLEANLKHVIISAKTIDSSILELTKLITRAVMPKLNGLQCTFDSLETSQVNIEVDLKNLASVKNLAENSNIKIIGLEGQLRSLNQTQDERLNGLSSAVRRLTPIKTWEIEQALRDLIISQKRVELDLEACDKRPPSRLPGLKPPKREEPQRPGRKDKPKKGRKPSRKSSPRRPRPDNCEEEDSKKGPKPGRKPYARRDSSEEEDSKKGPKPGRKPHPRRDSSEEEGPKKGPKPGRRPSPRRDSSEEEDSKKGPKPGRKPHTRRDSSEEEGPKKGLKPGRRPSPRRDSSEEEGPKPGRKPYPRRDSSEEEGPKKGPKPGRRPSPRRDSSEEEGPKPGRKPHPRRDSSEEEGPKKGPKPGRRPSPRRDSEEEGSKKGGKPAWKPTPHPNCDKDDTPHKGRQPGHKPSPHRPRPDSDEDKKPKIDGYPKSYYASVSKSGKGISAHAVSWQEPLPWEAVPLYRSAPAPKPKHPRGEEVIWYGAPPF